MNSVAPSRRPERLQRRVSLRRWRKTTRPPGARHGRPRPVGRQVHGGRSASAPPVIELVPVLALQPFALPARSRHTGSAAPAAVRRPVRNACSAPQLAHDTPIDQSSATMWCMLNSSQCSSSQAQQLHPQQRTGLPVEGLASFSVGDLGRPRLTLSLRQRTEIGDRQRHSHGAARSTCTGSIRT